MTAKCRSNWNQKQLMMLIINSIVESLPHRGWQTATPNIVCFEVLLLSNSAAPIVSGTQKS